MTGQIVDVSRNGLSLRKDRGSLVIKENGEELGRLDLEGVDVVVVSAIGATFSTNLAAALANQGSTIVIVDSNFYPTLMMMPCNGNYIQAKRMRAQSMANRPMLKRIWAQFVRAKILAQAEVLEHKGHSATRLRRLASEVRSGDPDNREAVAAQAYWRVLFGSEFRRKREFGETNAMLNYGYAVLRASAARAIVASGLHPSLSVHHVSNHDAFCLADDLMEPFRPAVDLVVAGLVEQGQSMDDVTTRGALANILTADYLTSNGSTPLSVAMVRVAQSLAGVFEGETKVVELPLSRLPLWEAAA